MNVTITQANLPEMLSVITQSVLDNRAISVDIAENDEDLYINSPEYLNAERVMFPDAKSFISHLKNLSYANHSA